jgi:sterol 3beta-glucosyltransferase
MKIIVPAIGSRGDVQPYINLCQGLSRAGHDAVLASLPNVRGLAESHGVEFAPVGPDVDLAAMTAQMWDLASGIWLVGFLRVMQLGARLVEQVYPDLLNLCRGADLIVVNDTTAGAAEGDKLGIPWVSVTLQPLRVPVPKKAKSGLRSKLNEAVWNVFGAMIAAPINGFRRRVGAPAVKGIISTGIMSDRLLMLPTSPAVVPPNPDWPPYVRETGFWFPELSADWRPPRDLEAFLAAGDPPVVICLGAMSMSGGNAVRAAEITLEALRKSGVRAVVQGWNAVLEGREMPPGVFRAGPLPHGWLLERAAGIVHHGGAGTTAAALRSGKPALIIPHIIDQFYWSQRVEAAGCGPAPIPRPKLAADNLAEGMRRLCNDREMRNRAAEMGSRIRAEGNGVERAVRLIEEIMARERPC